MVSLRSEQPGSLQRSLSEAGVRHGETCTVATVVGVYGAKDGAPVIAYCSSKMRVLSKDQIPWYQLGIWFYLFGWLISIRGEAAFGDAPTVTKAFLKDGKVQPGFYYMEQKVHTNGHIQMDVDPRSVRFLHKDKEEVLRKELGRPTAKKHLDQLLLAV